MTDVNSQRTVFNKRVRPNEMGQFDAADNFTRSRQKTDKYVESTIPNSYYIIAAQQDPPARQQPKWTKRDCFFDFDAGHATGPI
jgi:hypothetical protein